MDTTNKIDIWDGVVFETVKALTETFSWNSVATF